MRRLVVLLLLAVAVATGALTLPDAEPVSDPPAAPDDPAGPPDEPAGRPGRRRTLIGAGLAVLLVAVVVVVALVLGSGGGGSPTATVAGPTPSAAQDAGDGGSSEAPVAPAQGTSDQVAQQQAVIDYYSYIPTNLPEGWGRWMREYVAVMLRWRK